MYKARTNCMGCHVEQTTTKKGQRILQASGSTCVQCHTKDHAKMLADWKAELVKEIGEAKEIEQETLDALADAKSNLSEDKLTKAQQISKKNKTQ